MSRVISTHHQTAQRRYIPCSNWRWESKVSFLHCTITSWFAIAKDSYHPSQSVSSLARQFTCVIPLTRCSLLYLYWYIFNGSKNHVQSRKWSLCSRLIFPLLCCCFWNYVVYTIWVEQNGSAHLFYYHKIISCYRMKNKY